MNAIQRAELKLAREHLSLAGRVLIELMQTFDERDFQPELVQGLLGIRDANKALSTLRERHLAASKPANAAGGAA